MINDVRKIYKFKPLPVASTKFYLLQAIINSCVRICLTSPVHVGRPLRMPPYAFFDGFLGAGDRWLIKICMHILY